MFYLHAYVHTIIYLSLIIVYFLSVLYYMNRNAYHFTRVVVCVFFFGGGGMLKLVKWDRSLHKK